MAYIDSSCLLRAASRMRQTRCCCAAMGNASFSNARSTEAHRQEG
jgi:hypothetical protein